MRDLTGLELGRYRLTRLIGRGGMASAYEATDPVLDRVVAVKVLAEHFADEADFIGRFRHEAQAVAALRHPSIVRVYDFGSQDDHHYMVMEFIDGPSLVDLLADVAARGETLPGDAVVRLVTPVCSALDYAHARGMVHRDVKPANILLTADLQPVLSDYGIAKIAGMTTYTGPGMVLGTAAYMAPEQAQGLPADHRGDIYSLAVVAFEALVGRVPFEGETTGAVLAQHTVAPVPSARSLNPQLPAPVDVALERALAKEPAARYETAGQFAEALRRSLDVRPAQASGPVLPPATARTLLTGSGPAARGAAAKAAAAGASGRAAAGVTTPAHAAEPAASLEPRAAAAEGAAAPPAASPPRRGRRPAVSGRAVAAKQWTARFMGSGRRRTWVLTTAAVVAIVGGLIAAVATTTAGNGGHTASSPSPSDNPMAQAQQFMQMAQAALSAGMIQQAVARAQQGVDLDPSAANFQTLGLAYMGMPDGGDQATQAFQSAVDAGTQNAHTYALLADARFDDAWGANNGDYEPANEAAQKALELDEDEPLAHAVLAQIAAAKAVRAQALAEVDLALQNGSRDDVTLADIGWVYAMLDDWEHAVEYRELVVELAPNRADYRVALANAYRMNGQLPKAEQEARVALTLDSSWACRAHTILGLIKHEQGDETAAEKELQAALQADPSNDYALWGLGKILYDQGKYAAALPYFQRAVEAQPDDGGELTWLGACYLKLKRYDEARQALEHAIEVDPTRDDAQRLLKQLPSD